MALQQRTILDKTEFTEHGNVNLRQRVEIYDDVTGEVVSAKFVRESFSPDAYGEARAQAHGIKALTDIVWTKQVKDAHAARVTK